MCGCEHHWNSHKPCTCTCPEHAAARLTRILDDSDVSDPPVDEWGEVER